MRKLVLIIITSILTVISTSAVATTGAHLTTQAKHILWNELANENVTNAHHPEITCLAENIYFEDGVFFYNISYMNLKNA